ncbi:hypothetical protein [Pseudomonas sp. MH9.3]|uniref:hypothetical protein n=1 Tax=Pseudomonas sp. MH9.3 TaxID=3048630 RepID=UPI002AC96F00|nr:hypothetical protein [Pseudomonas sp. MH9.3]MEB0108279.1 hypothetical protein [Pseudomonas sp. MH9.3]WPX80478.1 hypothetical protein RHM60_05020 [Pseudomonas sp. MH9.3]
MKRIAVYSSLYMKVVISPFLNPGHAKLRNRGQKFWDWVKPDIHCRYKDERAADGSMINVQVRTAASGAIELFVGVYTTNGMMLFEDSYSSPLGQTMTQAMEWGFENAYAFLASSSVALTAINKKGALPRAPARGSK